jgi:beta-lactamase class A
MRSRVTRRSLLGGAAALPLAGCGGAARRPAAATPTATAMPDPARAREGFARLEDRFERTLGVWLLDTGTGAQLTHRADRRFPFCSTIKALQAGVLLRRDGLDGLEDEVAISPADTASAGVADVVQGALDAGRTSMAVRELCDAAVRFSDNAAANLLYARLGGPAGLARALRRLGDDVTRNDRVEPVLSEGRPGDPRDTTTPRQLGETLRALVVGDALAPAERAVLRGWLVRNTTGDAVIRAGVPGGWRVGDKTGTGGYGVRNDVAVLWPPDGAPLVLAVMTTGDERDAEALDPPLAGAARVALAAR